MKKIIKIVALILALSLGSGSFLLMIRFIVWIAQNIFGIGE